MVDPSLLDEEEKFRFVPQEVAAAVTSKHRFVTHRKSHVIYVYRNGFYADDGEEVIREEARKLLGDEASEHRVNEVVAHLEETTYELPERFDPPVNLICVDNGILDIGKFLETGNLDDVKLLPFTPDIIFLHQIPAPFDPRAKAPKVGKYFSDWMDPISIIRATQFAGYCLYRRQPIRKTMVAVGEGGNGKTTFVLFLMRWIGENNVTSTPVQDFGTRRFATSKLLGKLANLCDDLPPVAWFSTGFYKQLTGGSPVPIEFKFKKPFDTILPAKHLYTANRLPMVNDDTRAFWDRMMLISFPNTFNDGRKDREEILAEMLTTEEKSGFLNAALVGLYLLLKEQDFHAPEDINLVRDRYIHLSDPVAAFKEDRTVEEPDARELKSDLYSAYVNYCKEKGFSPTLSNIFSQILKKASPNIRSGQVRLDDGSRPLVWYGIRLKTQDEIKADEEARKLMLETSKGVKPSSLSSQNPHFELIREILNIEIKREKQLDTLDTLDTLDKETPHGTPDLGQQKLVSENDTMILEEEREGVLKDACVRCGRSDRGLVYSTDGTPLCPECSRNYEGDL